LELAMLSLIYVAIGGIIAYLGMFVLQVLPIFEYTISTTVLQGLGLGLAIVLAILLIGIIPVAIVFRLTPASIYNRFNRRINNE